MIATNICSNFGGSGIAPLKGNVELENKPWVPLDKLMMKTKTADSKSNGKNTEYTR